MRFILVLFLASVCYAQVCEDPNSEWKQCKNNCPPTCEEPDGADECIESCTPGCDCIPGLVLEKDECILLEDCQQQPECDDPNAEFTYCGSTCPSSCQEPNGGDGCGDACIIGCFCKEGYVDNGGQCTSVNECPVSPTCEDPNSVYNDCGSACPATCEFPDGGLACPDVCVEGCECSPGFVLENSRCIPTLDCVTV